ncbi:MAG: DUF1800 domain-containing protein [Pyrinomonadaceae bacterium]
MNTKTAKRAKLLSFFTIFALISPLLAIPASARNNQSQIIKRGLTEDQKIIHVLDRLGFGASPGDIERVKAIGIGKYIEQQLNPASIDNSAVDAKLKNYEILTMSTSDIFARYPNPGNLLRMLQGNDRNGRQDQRNDNAAMENDERNQQQMQMERQQRRRELREIYQKYDLRPANQIMTQIQSSRIIRAAYSERQLEETMVDFWANHFNVYSRKAATRWFIPSYERDVLRKNALGNFKDLVAGTAQHPAMLFYLDNFQSVAPASNSRGNSRQQNAMRNGSLPPRARQRLKDRGMTDEQIDQRIKQAQNMQNQRNQRGINENYARELMELHTLGVDGGYTQEDIKEVAKAFTGWTIFDPRGYRKTAGNEIQGREDQQVIRLARQLGISPNTESGKFVFVDRLHEKGPITVLGQKVNEGGMKDGLKVIDILVSQPATAKFIAKKLAVKFVSDEPSEALVDRVAKAFQNSKGDIKTTLRALFSDPEFFAEENYRAKIKTPFELLVSSLRALNVETNGSNGLIALLDRMGEPLYGYQAPTGYPDTAQDWVNTGALLERMNFAVALASNQIPQTRVDLKQFAGTTTGATLEKGIGQILNGEISDNTRSMLLKQIAQPLPEINLESKTMDDDDDQELMRDQRPRVRNQQARLSKPKGDPEVFKVVGLIIGSPEFQRQ